MRRTEAECGPFCGTDCCPRPRVLGSESMRGRLECGSFEVRNPWFIPPTRAAAPLPSPRSLVEQAWRTAPADFSAYLQGHADEASDPGEAAAIREELARAMAEEGVTPRELDLYFRLERLDGMGLIPAGSELEGFFKRLKKKVKKVFAKVKTAVKKVAKKVVKVVKKPLVALAGGFVGGFAVGRASMPEAEAGAEEAAYGATEAYSGAAQDAAAAAAAALARETQDAEDVGASAAATEVADRVDAAAARAAQEAVRQGLVDPKDAERWAAEEAAKAKAKLAIAGGIPGEGLPWYGWAGLGLSGAFVLYQIATQFAGARPAARRRRR